MCGIFGYINFLKDQKLKDILIKLLNGLSKMEYRGYDSCGICFDILNNEERKLVVAKTHGTVDALTKTVEEYLKYETVFKNHISIGHTRWATHGPPTARNAHPHFSSPNFEFVVCHNGIISNYAELRNRLLQEGIFKENKSNDDDKPVIIEQHDGESEFIGESDTEVIAKLAFFTYKKLYEQNGTKPSFLDVILNTMKIVNGTYAAIFKSSLYPEECIAARLSSPLLLGLKYEGSAQKSHAIRNIDISSEKSMFSILDDSEINTKVQSAPRPYEVFLASDGTAFAEHTKDVLILHDWDVVHITSTGVDIINTSPNNNHPQETSRLTETLEVSLQSIAKGSYPHFMLKEIYEQPNTLRMTMGGRLLYDQKEIVLGGIIPHLSTIKHAKTLMFIGCGTSYNAALSVRPLFEKYTKQRIFVEVASDFNDRKPIIFRDDVCIFLSQSGETADTLISLEYCKKLGAFCVGINNTPGSSLSRGTDCGIHLNAGVEIGVASTKCYTSMIVALIMILLLLMQDSVSLNNDRIEAISDLQKLPTTVSSVLSLAPQVEKIAEFLCKQKNIIVLGRKTHYATARETALKVKELTYIHSEGLMAGELKHGPLALIDEKSMVIFFATGEDDEMFSACRSSLEQIKARGAKVLVIATEKDSEKINSISDWLIVVPNVTKWTQMIINIIPMQLLSYYTALNKGINVDRPRNLAKSVTVL